MKSFAIVHVEERLDRRRGATLVELLVTALCLGLLAIGLGKAIGAAAVLEQNYREESAVYSALAVQLSYAERYLSLATNVTTNYQAGYRLETGGVSFETNHWRSVSALSMLIDTNMGETAMGIVSGDARRDPGGMGVTQRLSPYGLGRIAIGTNVLVALDGQGAVRRLRLGAECHYRKWTNGTWVWTTTNLFVERPVRLWNQP